MNLKLNSGINTSITVSELEVKEMQGSLKNNIWLSYPQQQAEVIA